MKFDSVKILASYILLLIYFLNYLLREYDLCSSSKMNIFYQAIVVGLDECEYKVYISYLSHSQIDTGWSKLVKLRVLTY